VNDFLTHSDAVWLSGYPIPPIVYVIGAYQGNTVRHIRNLSPETRIFAFDPQQWALDRWLGDARIWKFPVALALHTGEVSLSGYETDGASSAIYRNGPRATLRSVDAREFLRFIPSPQLIVMNIEGAEHELIPHIEKMCPDCTWLVQNHGLEDRLARNLPFENAQLIARIADGWEVWS